jgi:transcriptional regulator with XRE-family HTH domain
MNKEKFLLRESYNTSSWRRASGLTSYDIAAITGYAPQTIIQFENGKNNNMFLYFFYLNYIKSLCVYKVGDDIICDDSYNNFASLYDMPRFEVNNEYDH